MKIPSYYVREGSQYTKTDLFKKFSLAEKAGEKFLSLLLQYGVLASTRQASADPLFKFSFVGIVFFHDLSIRCFPKYIHSTETPHQAFAQVLNVLRRYGRESKAELYPRGESERMEFSLIAEAFSLLDDYVEHGVYSNTVSDIEYNGTGEILWDKTLSSVDPFYCNDVPFYFDAHTKMTVDDTSDYVTRVHKHILTECSLLLEDADLLPIFGLSPLQLSEEPREHFGPDDYILHRLRSELDIQFDCRKQELLRRLIRFIERRETDFEFVWEKACAKALGDQLHTLLEKLPLPRPLGADYMAATTLMSLIKKPEWHLVGTKSFSGNGTLIPDIAIFYRYREETLFLILDAKYYDPANLAQNHPGIEDIDKQYLYEVAFKPFLDSHGVQQVQNIFLLPTEGDNLEYRGYVEFTMLKNLGCENIKIILLPAKRVFSSYLNEGSKDSLAKNLLDEVCK